MFYEMARDLSYTSRVVYLLSYWETGEEIGGFLDIRVNASGVMLGLSLSKVSSVVLKKNMVNSFNLT